MTNIEVAGTRIQWTLGDRLGKALRMENVSNQEMAAILGVSRNTVGNYIADRTPIKDASIRVWAMRTGVSFEELKIGIVSGGRGPTPGLNEQRPHGVEPRAAFELLDLDSNQEPAD